MRADKTGTAKLVTPELSIWDKLELEFLLGGRSGTYLTRIEGFEEECPIIARPEWLSGEPLFCEGSPCGVTYFGPVCAYRFASKVLRSFTSNQREMYVLAAPRSFERIQRRRFARVEISIAFRFKEVSRVIAGTERYDDLEWQHSSTHDLSAGGILFSSDHAIKPGSILSVQLSLPATGWVFRTLAKVARCERDAAGMWLIGFELISREEFSVKIGNIDLSFFPEPYQTFGENERNLISNFVFNEEVKIRRREYHKESEL
ncbi:MAG: flagellar brake protein [Candidatus Zixiibacteriota bacterium]